MLRRRISSSSLPLFSRSSHHIINSVMMRKGLLVTSSSTSLNDSSTSTMIDLHPSTSLSMRFCSSANASTEETTSSSSIPVPKSDEETPSSSSAVLSLSQMEHNLKRQLGPQSQLLVREQFTAAGRRKRREEMKKKKNLSSHHQAQQQKPRRLGSEIMDDTTADTNVVDKTQENKCNDEDEGPLVIFRSSVTFRQCGFAITLSTAESSKSAEEALRLAYNGAVSTDVSFFNPTLRPQDAAVFDRVRFLALGLGKMIRFSIGGGGDEKLQQNNNSVIKEKKNELNVNDEAEAEDEDDDGAPIYTCAALMKDDFDVIGKAKDATITTTIGRSAQEAFNRAVVATRDKLTQETEEGEHALEDVRELQLFLNNNINTADDFMDFGIEKGDNNKTEIKSGKLLHPELSVNYNKNNRNNNNNASDTTSSNISSKNYTAKITVTDSFGNSYYVKSGDFNKTAIAAYRSCVNQIYKKESFLSQKPQKSFFGQVQWLTEHLTWHSGLARSLDWEFHYRSTVRSSFSAAQSPQQQRNNSNNINSSGGASASSSFQPTYLHTTLHIGPVELAFADGAGRYRVMLNTYCNALERLLMNAPKRYSEFLQISSVPSLYALYMETDRFQPVDSLKGAIKGLNPQTVLGAVMNLHLGSYFQMPIERRESALLTKMQKDNNNNNNQQRKGGNTNNGNDMASEDVVFVVATLPNQETTITIAEQSTIKPGTKMLVLGRTTASRLACTYALRDNFPIIFNQVKDRPDFKQAGADKEQEKRLQKLRSLPRDKRIQQYDSLLTLLREFGGEDHGWADVDIDCKLRNVGLWVATVYIRLKKDNTTRDIRVSRPTSTKQECRKRVILETAFTYYPQETQMYLAKDAKKEEYSKNDLAAVMGNQIASSIKPYDPVSSGSVTDQMLAILEERSRTMRSMTTASSTNSEGESSTAANASSNSNMIEELVGDEDVLRVSCEMITEDPYPKSSLTNNQQGSSSSTTTSKFSFFDHDQKEVRYNINIIASPALLPSSVSRDNNNNSSSYHHSGKPTSSGDTYDDENTHRVSGNHNNSGGAGSQKSISLIEQKLLFHSASLPGTPLLQAIRETVTSAAKSLQLDAERIRLLIASFEEYKIPQIFRPQDLAEWLLKSNFGLENVKVEVNHTQSMWVGALYVKFPVQECYWPGNDYQRQQLRKNRYHLKLARQAHPFRKKALRFLEEKTSVPINLPSSFIFSSANSSSHHHLQQGNRKTFGGSTSSNYYNSDNNKKSGNLTKVFEWVEISRVIATTKREAIKLCYIKAAMTNCYAHLQYMAKKSLEQQADAEEVLACDTEQYHSLVTSEQVAHFLKLSPSPLSVLRTALKQDKLKLQISVDLCDPPPPPTTAISSSDNGAGEGNNNSTREEPENNSSSSSSSFRPLFSKRFALLGKEGKDRGNDLGASTSSSSSASNSLSTNSNNSGHQADSSASFQQQQYYECTLFSSPLYGVDDMNNNSDVNENDDHDTSSFMNSIKIISRQKSTSPETALNDAVLKALDDLFGDDDLKYWLSRWRLEMLSAEEANLEKIAIEMEME